MKTKKKYHIAVTSPCRHAGKSLEAGEVLQNVPHEQATGLLSSGRCIPLTAEQAKVKAEEFKKAKAAREKAQAASEKTKAPAANK